MNPELRQAIDNVYVAFDDVPKPLEILGCPCCLDDEEIKILLSKERRQLSPTELSSYASCVFLTVGEVPDFLYLLPRILEIRASENGWWPDPEVVGRSLRSGGFDQWPEEKRQAVLRYFHAVLADKLQKPEDRWDIDSWICALAKFLPDISAYLDQVEAVPDGVIEFYKANAGTVEAGGLANAFWERDEPAYQQVVAWFNSDRVAVIKAENWRQIES